jgi:hypothetical protein
MATKRQQQQQQRRRAPPTQQHELAAPLQRAPRGVLDQVDALLVHQPRDAAHHRHVHVRQPHALPQLAPRRRLALHHVLMRVRHRQEGVLAGVPDLVVDAVPAIRRAGGV